MDGGTFPFVAGCIFFGMGALLILSLLQYLWQRPRLRGRVTGTIVSIETLSAAERPGAVSASADTPETNPAANRYYRPVVAYYRRGTSVSGAGCVFDAALDDADHFRRRRGKDRDPDRPAAV
jgi:hypothetical protein